MFLLERWNVLYWQRVEINFVQIKQEIEYVGDPQRFWYKKALSGKMMETEKVTFVSSEHY